MDAISFASLDLSHYVSYVAKETDNDGVAIDDSRACHVIECESPRQANEIYAAVEYAFNQRAREPIKPMVIPEKAFGTLSGKNWDDTIPQGVEPSYYNTDPNKVPPESGLRRQPMPGQVLYANQEVIDDMVNSPPANSRPPKPIRARRSTDKNYVNQDVVDEHNRKTRNSSTDSNETIGTPTSNIRASTSSTSSMSSLSSFTPQPGESDQHRRLREIVSEARGLEYFHSFSSNPRKAVDEKLKEDGDFLLREASIFLIPNQIRNITLSVLNTIKGKAVIKHVLLIMSPKEDTENPIHTRDKSFSSISELIDYYMEDQRILQMPRDNPDSEEGNIKISNPIKKFIYRSRTGSNERLYCAPLPKGLKLLNSTYHALRCEVHTAVRSNHCTPKSCYSVIRNNFFFDKNVFLLKFELLAILVFSHLFFIPAARAQKFLKKTFHSLFPQLVLLKI